MTNETQTAEPVSLEALERIENELREELRHSLYVVELSMESVSHWADELATLRACLAQQGEAKTCTWLQEDWESDCWATSCGQAFSINDGTPSENSMKHCCYCGRHVAEELWVDPNEDDDDAALTPPSAKGE